MSHCLAPGRGSIGDFVDLLLQRKFLLRQTAELCLLPAQQLPASTCRPPLLKLLHVFVKIIICILICGRLRDGAGAGTTMG